MKSDFRKKQIAINIALALAMGTITVGCAGNSTKPMQSSTVEQETTPVASTEKATPVDANGNGELDMSKLEINQVDLTPESIEENSSTSESENTFPDIEISENTKPEQLNFQFGFDKAELSENDVSVIREHAKYLLENPETIINVNGHTDHYGPKVYNEYLSKKRADAVARVLIEGGAQESQIHISALANDEPLLDVENTRMNRRVELKYTEMNFVSAQ